MLTNRLEAQVGFNYGVRFFAHERMMDSITWSKFSKNRENRTIRPSELASHATSRAILGHQILASGSQIDIWAMSLTAAQKSRGIFKPKLAYEVAEIRPPRDFTDGDAKYVQMDIYERSRYMQGNIKLASETMLWAMGDRVGSWPSMVNSRELNKLVKTELDELSETDVVREGERISPLNKTLMRDKTVPWYLDPEAEAVWDVAGEVADIGFCAVQYWLAYDGFTIEQCVKSGTAVMNAFDQIDSQLSDNDLRGLIEEVSRNEARQDKYDWPEKVLGISYLLSKRMGVDLWEAITLKCLANIRQYPSSMQLVEEGRKRKMNERRTPAWVFAKGMRRRFSPEKRFIPPMSDAFARETVLDMVYGSPYLENDKLDLVGLAQSAVRSGLEYAIPEAVANADLADKTGQGKYY